jgi:hypothetical protein
MNSRGFQNAFQSVLSVQIEEVDGGLTCIAESTYLFGCLIFLEHLRKSLFPLLAPLDLLWYIMVSISTRSHQSVEIQGAETRPFL